MMTVVEILKELEQLGTEQTRNTWIRHGAEGYFFGVKIGDMKPIQKRIKQNYELSMRLYETKNLDAMYLAGLISEPIKMTRTDLDNWAKKATWSMISEYSVAWTAAESPLGFDAATNWIDSEIPSIAATGWSTLASWVCLIQNQNVNIEKLNHLLDKVENEINTAPNRVKYTMNNFVISVGAYIEPLSDNAISVGQRIGRLEIAVGNTLCKIPFAPEYIKKSIARGSFYKKKRTAKC